MNSGFYISYFRLTLEPREPIRLPRFNKGITLRGAFGSSFRRLVCVDQKADCSNCMVHPSCPYGFIFSPRIPENAERLRLNRDIPRPFVIKPPLEAREIYEPGEALSFGLVVVGRARGFLPYFLLSFRDLGERGIGVGRGRFNLKRVEILDSVGHAEPVLKEGDTTVRVPDIRIRLEDKEILPGDPFREITLRFLTPVLIKQDGRWVPPTFGALLRRLRDRINALCYFYCGKPLDLDFKAIGEASDEIRVSYQDLRWVEESRYSRHRGIRQAHKGYVGVVRYKGEMGPFLPLVAMGQYVHVGKASAFGQGWYRIET